MAEMKGGMVMAFIFIILVIPTFIMFSMNTLHNNYFMKATTEFTDVVKNEGGMTDHAKDVKNRLEEDKGYSTMVIKVTDSTGKEVTGVKKYGERINIEYEYTYRSVRPLKISREGGSNIIYPKLYTREHVIVTKR